MTKRKSISCLNALDLKLLAMVLMFCDHLWATVIPGATWLTNIGRIAFPIFAFQIAEGFEKTSNVGRYIKRMLFFALLSEIPYDIMMVGVAPIRAIFRELTDLFTGGDFSANYFFRSLLGLMTHQNVMFTFLLALLLLQFLRWVKGKSKLLFVVMLPVAAFAGYFAGQLLFVDYHGEGVLMVLLFWLCRQLPMGWIGELVGMAIINCWMIGGMTIPFTVLGHTFQFPQQGFALLALLPIWLYNGKQGPHNRAIQLMGYAFYPVHILILSLLAIYDL